MDLPDVAQLNIRNYLSQVPDKVKYSAYKFYYQ